MGIFLLKFRIFQGYDYDGIAVYKLAVSFLDMGDILLQKKIPDR